MNEISLGDLIEFFNKAFPVLPDTPDGITEKALEQFERKYIGSIQVISDPVPAWSQGDILELVTFLDWNDNGDPVYFECPGMIVTSTCDLDRRDHVVVCPCYLLDDLEGESFKAEVSGNRVFDFFYVGRILNGDKWCVDLSHPMTFPRDRLLHKIESGQISRKHSLTQKGWYLFITKFSMKYCRPDDVETMNLR